MSYRIWYPQLDVFDCIRRLALLLAYRPTSTTAVERILITDFFLANPPLLHSVHMPSETRGHFRDLQIPRPEKGFLTFPAAPLLFHKMEPIQSKALREMTGKGLLRREPLENRQLALSESGLSLMKEDLPYSEGERAIAAFLACEFADLNGGELEELRQRTGLRRLAS